MSLVMGEAVVPVVPSARGFGTALSSQVRGGSIAAGRSSGKHFGAGLLASMKTVVGPMAALFTIMGAKKFAEGAIADARAANKVSRETESRIKATGGVANVTAGHIARLSTAMMFKVGVDDEQIKTSMNLLLGFKNVHNEAGRGNKIFDQAAKLAMDVSVAQKKGLNPTTIALGKALNDPVKGMTALSRYGIQFTDQQKKMVKGMIDHGHTLKAQRFILDSLKSRFKGVAAAQADAGDKMRVAWGEVQESVGQLLLKAFTPLMAFLGGRILPAVLKFFDQLHTGAGIGGKVRAVFEAVIGTFGRFTKYLWDARAVLGPLLAGIGAYIVVTRTVTGVTKAWAAAQMLLSKAFVLSPIGFVIVGLVALGAALVLAYHKSATFRKIVDETWTKIRVAVKIAWERYIKPALAAFTRWVTHDLGPALKWFGNKVVAPTFKVIAKVVAWTCKNVVGPALKLWWTYISKVLAPVIIWLLKHVVGPTFKTIGHIIGWTWQHVIRPVFHALADFVTKTIPKAFRTGVDGVKRIWQGLVNIAKKPVNFVIGTIYNNGLRKVINAIGGVFGMKTLGTVATLNRGGPVKGGVPHRDSVPALLTPQEHVWTEEEVAGAGGHRAVERLRNLARRKRIAKVGDIPAFKKGGYLTPADIARGLSFARAQSGKPYIWGGVGPGGYDCSGFQSAITNVLRGQYPYRRLGSTGTMPFSGFRPGYGQYTTGWFNGSPGHTAGTLAGVNVESTGDHVRVGGDARGASNGMFTHRAYLGGPGAPGSPGGGGGGLGLGWDMGAIKSALSTLVGLPGKISDNLSGSGFGKFLSRAFMGMLGKVKDWAADKLGLKSLLKVGANLFDGFKSIVGKILPFDTGGLLRPGGLGVNLTGRPERVLDPQTTRSFDRLAGSLAGGGSMVGALTITNWQDGTGYFRLLARDENAADAAFTAQRRRMG